MQLDVKVGYVKTDPQFASNPSPADGVKEADGSADSLENCGMFLGGRARAPRSPSNHANEHLNDAGRHQVTEGLLALDIGSPRPGRVQEEQVQRRPDATIREELPGHL